MVRSLLRYTQRNELRLSLVPVHNQILQLPSIINVQRGLLEDSSIDLLFGPNKPNLGHSQHVVLKRYAYSAASLEKKTVEGTPNYYQVSSGAIINGCMGLQYCVSMVVEIMVTQRLKSS